MSDAHRQCSDAMLKGNVQAMYDAATAAAGHYVSHGYKLVACERKLNQVQGLPLAALQALDLTQLWSCTNAQACRQAPIQLVQMHIHNSIGIGKYSAGLCIL